MLLLLGLGLITVFALKYFFATQPKNLTGQTILVTGGANGLGKELCMRFARLGCKLAVADLDLDNAKKTVKEILAKGVCKEACAYKVDVSVLSEIEKLRENIEKDLGVVDVVVNNAGILFCKPIETEDPKILEKIMDVNIMSIFWTTRVFLPGMKQRKRGHIVSIASSAALIGAPQLHAYSTSKFAVRGFMESLKSDLHREGHDSYIHTTTAYPWFIDTREFIQEFTSQMYKHCYKFKPIFVAKKIVDGVARNEKEVVVPWFLYHFGYLINIVSIVNIFIRFNGVPPKSELVVKDNPVPITT